MQTIKMKYDSNGVISNHHDPIYYIQRIIVFARALFLCCEFVSTCVIYFVDVRQRYVKPNFQLLTKEKEQLANDMVIISSGPEVVICP